MLDKLIDAKRAFDVQNQQYQNKLVLEDTVPGEQTKLGRVNVTSLGNFYCIFITGQFTTLKKIDQDITDTDVNYLTGQLKDGSNNRTLFNDYASFNLWLTPGRVRHDSAVNLFTTAQPSGRLFYPHPFEYLFPINGDILLDVRSTSNADNYYTLLFHGWYILPRAPRNVG
jgi:hypothetical protein